MGADRDIVVGFDGSEGAVAAVEWAAAAGRDAGATLRVLAAARTPVMPWPVGITAPVVGDAEPVAKALAEEGAHLAASLLPRDRIVPVPSTDHPVNSLVHESESADLLVVGTRGHGAFRSAVLGSVSSAVAVHARCPVVVVRPTSSRSHPSTGAVVVGLDDSTSNAAVDFAAREAVRRGAVLRLVCAWMTVDQAGWEFAAWQPEVAHQWTSDVVSAASQLVETTRARLARQHPQLVVTTHTPQGPAGPSLVDAAFDADLVVVGGVTDPSDAPRFLGPVAHHLLHHADCPVALVPTRTAHHR